MKIFYFFKKDILHGLKYMGSVEEELSSKPKAIISPPRPAKNINKQTKISHKICLYKLWSKTRMNWTTLLGSKSLHSQLNTIDQHNELALLK